MNRNLDQLMMLRNVKTLKRLAY